MTAEQMFTEKSNPIISYITIISAIVTVPYFLSSCIKSKYGVWKRAGFSCAFMQIGLGKE